MVFRTGSADRDCAGALHASLQRGLSGWRRRTKPADERVRCLQEPAAPATSGPRAVGHQNNNNLGIPKLFLLILGASWGPIY